ncbi:hypothetical protein FOA43_002737 [Brettanomyces nanus]|uniref:ASTRA-associated protein 1 n=1 Tax=Eeniella nana TaxID=13502 RepID=A0A875S3A3_EENNA|nr:uncharacterized protein FOA43_002737 [Brettanomyces nanus]QPG75383.1 hypothetical protein FOA43_002737 [Brettanomyces nanus]
MSSSRKLEGTLRGHKAGISAIQFLYLPTALTYSTSNTRHHFLKPTLITGDESGLIIWWDLTTRRQLTSWQAHGTIDSASPNAVITLQQLGITWMLSQEGTYEFPVIDKRWYGCLLSHGKDGEIKIWRLFSVVTCGDYGLKYQLYTPLHQALPPKVVFQMPVNMLNFSNVEMVDDRLVTPGTEDSNKFDIYTVPIPGTDESGTGLKRLFKAVQFESDNPNFTHRNGFGIVMKFAWIDRDHIAVGYESGHVVTYELAQNTVKAITINSIHTPEPVTALYYDWSRDIILSASSTDCLAIMSGRKAIETSSLSFPVDTTSAISVHHIKHRGIGDLSVSTDGTVGVVTWDGYTRFFHYTEGNSDLTFVFKVKRQAPSISDNRISSDNDIKQESLLHSQKSSALVYSRTQIPYTFIKESRTLEYNDGMSKNLVRRRLERNFDNHWALIGYKDGRVAVYSEK